MVFEQTWSCPHYDDDFIGYGFSPIVLFSTNKSLAHLTDRIVEWINAGRVLVNGMVHSFVFYNPACLWRNDFFYSLRQMTSYAYLIAPPGAGTTLQGIFGAVFEGLGNNNLLVTTLKSDKSFFIFGNSGTAIGSLLGGFIFQNYGGATMYRSFGIYTLVFGILYASIHAFMDRRNKLTRKGKI